MLWTNYIFVRIKQGFVRRTTNLYDNLALMFYYVLCCISPFSSIIKTNSTNVHFFINRVPVAAPSCGQVAPLAGWVHMSFWLSCSNRLSNPLCVPSCLSFCKVSVLPFLLSSYTPFLRPNTVVVVVNISPLLVLLLR